MISFEQFLASNQKPNVVQVDPKSVNLKSVSEMKLMTESEVLNGDFVQVCDNMQWLCTTTDSKGRITYISSDNELVYQFVTKRHSMLGHALTSGGILNLTVNDRLTFKEEEPEHTTNNKEDFSMADEKKSIEQLMDEVAPANTTPSGGANMTAFDNVGGGEKTAAAGTPEAEAAKAQRAAERKVYDDTMNRIRSEAKSTAGTDDISLLQDSWRKSAQHLAWITPSDARDTITAVKQAVPADQRVLVANAPDAVKAQFAKKAADVDAQYIQSVYKIEARRSKPGKPVGALVRMPAFLKGKTVQEFTNQIVTQGPKSDADSMVSVEMLTIGDYEQKLTLVGGSIPEAPETHGGTPSEIKINYSVAKAKANSGSGLAVNAGTVLTKKFVRVGNGNKTVLSNDNYFPLTTYETYDIYAPLPADIIDQLNASCFESIFSGGKASPSKYRSLSPAEQANIKQEGDKITSNYITSGAGMIKLEVKEFFNKEQARDTVRIPLKTRKEKADGTTSALSFVKYSCTADEKKLSDPEYAKHTSLQDPRFAKLIELAGADVLNASKLRETFKRGTGGGTNKSLDALTARALLKAKILGNGFNDYRVEGLKLAE